MLFQDKGFCHLSGLRIRTSSHPACPSYQISSAVAALVKLGPIPLGGFFIGGFTVSRSYWSMRKIFPAVRGERIIFQRAGRGLIRFEFACLHNAWNRAVTQRQDRKRADLSSKCYYICSGPVFRDWLQVALSFVCPVASLSRYPNH